MVSTFKKIGLAVLLTAITGVSANAQTPKKDNLKKHQCTKQCTNGKHLYKHGEKNHTCDADCKKIK